MRRGIFASLDLGLLTPVLVLLIVSLTSLFSVSLELFRNQLIFALVSLFAFIFFSQVNHKIIRLYGLPIYIISIILLALVLFLGIESRGATRWIEIAGFRIQFSEVLKPFLAISLSSFLINRNLSVKTFSLTFLFLLPIIFLIALQPDLGNAVIYFSALVFTLIFYGFPIRYFILSLVVFTLSVPLLWRFLHDYQRQRIISFFNPSMDPLGASYNAVQSIIAVGSGMLLGKGLGLGTQSGLRFLPERHTDFIFATISEQLGFVGSLVIILAFAALLYRIFNIFYSTDDEFSKVFCAIAFFVILIQFFINVGMNIGLLPVVGVTLPFISYGGSSLLSNFIILGILSAISRSAKEKEVLEIK